MGPEASEFLKNCWYVAAWEHELAGGKLMARTILGKPLVLFKGDSGRVVALDDRCAHRGARLSNGRREGDCVRCMYHGLKFDADGKCVQIPGQDNIPPKLGVRSYPTVERDRLVWIWMGEAAAADPGKILDFPYLRDPAWRGKPGYMHYQANYLLIVDNLSDFAHLAFVHTKTLGGSEEYAYKSKPTAIERLADGFRVERWHMDAPSPPFHRKIKINSNTEKVDRRNIARMYVPGIFFMETLLRPAGSEDGAKQYRNCQFFTPETARSTHFFWDYLHDYGLEDPAIAESLHQSMVEGFLEDKFIIEGQQETLDADPQFKMSGIVADAPLAHFRRVLSKRIAEERGATELRSA